MLTLRLLIGYFAVAVSGVGYFVYFRDIFAGHTKPHAFSWLVWTLLTAIAFAAQITQGGGVGAWITGFSAAMSCLIFLLSIRSGWNSFPLVDWIALGVAFMAILLWNIADTPTISVVLVSSADAIGYIPTFRKGYFKPFEETVLSFALSGIKYALALIVLERYTLSTWLFPASLVLTNTLFVAMIIARRSQIDAAGSGRV